MTAPPPAAWRVISENGALVREEAATWRKAAYTQPRKTHPLWIHNDPHPVLEEQRTGRRASLRNPGFEVLIFQGVPAEMVMCVDQTLTLSDGTRRVWIRRHPCFVDFVSPRRRRFASSTGVVCSPRRPSTRDQPRRSRPLVH